MQSSSYQELIEEKIEEWKGKITELEVKLIKERPKNHEEAFKMLTQLSKSVDSAALKLRELDKQENADNTLEIKESILKIFDSIDKVLVDHEDKTPFML